ncbi:SMP-30/gluconolactonase/LRE family protein [Zobellia amurskyensis]|uniref:SMP-30/gluconolactonase/LRE family protein n=1 Tax=Zobellia amurskyensis TaxID=248905 RepID=A0A7X3D1D8_9FLAO|nr:SMP-30/gluconolactonase/LRE family protein [Zobellia amurskyensis]MUH36064.1 SMP-30/gluconolactonase/LRE family protein [Zobellia amurskyensis]
MVETVLDSTATLGEGVFWHPQEKKVYWVDIYGKEIHATDPKTGSNQTFKLPEYVGTIAPINTGGLLVALENGVVELDTETGEFFSVLELEKDKPSNRFNDGKCDPKGRFWVGSMCREGLKPTGALYSINTDKSFVKRVENITVSNGITWSLDHKTMYYIDSPTRKVVAYSYDVETGSISNPIKVIDVPEEFGFPDGMTIDNEGMLWIALWGGNSVSQWNPNTGELIQKIIIPAPHVTSCAFGGEDQRKLFITTAREGLTEAQLDEYPLSGSLFTIELPVGGPEVFFFNKLIAPNA